MIESKLMADVLRSKVNKSTLKTDEFENECDENGCRKYGQNDKRWWDESTGRQIEHLICWFARKYYKGSTQECYDNCNCENCAFKDMQKKPEGFGEEKDAKKVFNRMGKPEMYICIAEVLEVIREEKLIEFVSKIKEAMNNEKSWREVRKQYFVWEMIEEKINTAKSEID